MPQTTVPDVIGFSEAGAIAAIESADLTKGVTTTAYSDAVFASHIADQEPAAGDVVPVQSAVNIVVSLGPELLVNITSPTQATLTNVAFVDVSGTVSAASATAANCRARRHGQRLPQP